MTATRGFAGGACAAADSTGRSQWSGTRQVERHLKVVRFGRQEPLDIDAGAVVTFPQGLVGMEELRQFVVIDDARTLPCRWLQSVDDPSLAFVIVDPHLIRPDYLADIPAEDAAQLELERPSDADIWAIVTIQPDPSRSTVNLLAPIVINRRARLGKQIILTESRYAIRHPLVAGSARAAAGE